MNNKKISYPEWNKKYEIKPRTVQQNKSGERKFHEGVESVHEEVQRIKRYQEAQINRQLDKPVQVHRVNSLAIWFWLAVIIVIAGLVLWNL